MGFGFGMLLWWAVIIGGIVLLVKWLGTDKNLPQGGKTPMEILKERYARGEISDTEFEHMREKLNQ